MLLDLKSQQDLLLLGRLEEYIVRGIARDIDRAELVEWEWKRLLELARLQIRTPGMFRRYLKQEDDEDMDLTKIILFKEGKTDDNPDGCTVPKEVLEKAADTFNKAVGLATIEDGKFVILRQLINIEPAEIVGVLVNNLQKYMQFPVVVFLSNTDKQEGIQPFPVLGTKEEPDVIGFLQGDPAALEGIFTVVHELRKNSSNFEDFWADLTENPRIVKKIKDALVGDSCLLIMTKTGDIVEFDKNDNIVQNLDWGAAYGLPRAEGGGTPQSVPPASDDSKKTGFDGFSAGASKSTTSEPPSVPTTPAREAATGGEVADDGKAVQRPVGADMIILKAEDLSRLDAKLRSRVSGDGKVNFKNNKEPHFQCPQYVDDGKGGQREITKQEAQKWYEENMIEGLLPKNWGMKPKPLVPASFMSIRSSRVELADMRTATSSVALATNGDVRGDTAAKNVNAPFKWDDNSVNDFMSNYADPKVIGSNNERITNPLDLIKLEEKQASLFEKSGKKPEELLMGPVWRLKICKEAPNYGQAMWGHWQYLAMQRAKQVSDQQEYIGLLEKENSELKASAKPAPTTVAKPEGFASFGNRG